MSNKRSFNLSSLNAKKAKFDETVGNNNNAAGGNNYDNAVSSNPYLHRPIEHPEKALQNFLYNKVRKEARAYLPDPKCIGTISKPYCEVEARLGIFKASHSAPSRRVTSGGTKRTSGGTKRIPDQQNQQQQQLKIVHAFDCTGMATNMISGVSRSSYMKSTSAGLSELSPLSASLGCTIYENLKKGELTENEYIETVYTGYPNDGRCCFLGEHDHTSQNMIGKMESKRKLGTFDMTVPSAHYDIRITLSSEKIMDHNIRGQPPNGWKTKRIKRRRSYKRTDKRIVWQIDVTEVTTIENNNNNNNHEVIDYEIEMELNDIKLLQLINESDELKANKMCYDWSQQLWWILNQINPLHDSLDVEEYIQDHPNHKAIQLAIAQCAVLKKVLDNTTHNNNNNNQDQQPIVYESPISQPNQIPSPSLCNINFIGCMPVNFSRHNIDEIQRSPDNAYYLSEKTDGVRYLMVFTGETVVLLDRKMCGKQIIPSNKSNNGDNNNKDPMDSILDLIRPGTVFDGEVVINRSESTTSSSITKCRPIFIVFDILSISTSHAILHLPFEIRKKHLYQATFREPTATRDMFADPNTFITNIDSLPLVRKNFVKRTELDNLLQHVVEERNMRLYRNGKLYNHLTDGIIFQPNLPYVCGTDINLLKWKYIDTVTIDIELLLPNQLYGRAASIAAAANFDDDNDSTSILHVGCLGEEQTRVDMTRYVKLPISERMRLEADKFESNGGRIAEVGFDPETGEWYYMKIRSDKVLPNHISTVLGTLLELAESLSTDELRYRMSVPTGQRDTYHKEIRNMYKGLLDFQRKRNHTIIQQKQQQQQEKKQQQQSQP